MNFDDTLKARANLTDREVEKMKSRSNREWWLLPVGAFAIVVWIWGLVSFIKFILNIFL